MTDPTGARRSETSHAFALLVLVAVLMEACSGSSRAVEGVTPASPTASAAVAGEVRAPAALEPYAAGSIGYAVSWPQCGGSLPRGRFEFGIVGVTDGVAFTTNPCIGQQYAWAHGAPQYVGFYMNTNFDPASYGELAARLKDACTGKGDGCVAYLYGRAEGDYAFSHASAVSISAAMWWLDVQIVSSWSDDVALNALTIHGVIDELQSHGARVGISSTPFLWHQVAGDVAPALPGWVAGASDEVEAAVFCDGRQDFGGGRTEQIAYVKDAYEMVRACGDRR